MIMGERAGALSPNQDPWLGRRDQVTSLPVLSTPNGPAALGRTTRVPAKRWPNRRLGMESSPRERTRRWALRVVRAVLSAVALFALLWSGGLAWFAEASREASDRPDLTTEAIVVPTGGSGRLEEGLSLLESGLAQMLFVTGVGEGVERAELRESHDSALWACCVELGYEAEDTEANAREAAAWMESRSFTSLRLVTSGYHMLRATMEFRSAMPNATLVAHPVFPEHVKVEHWWRYRGTAALIASEFTKYLWALARRAL